MSNFNATRMPKIFNLNITMIFLLGGGIFAEWKITEACLYELN